MPILSKNEKEYLTKPKKFAKNPNLTYQIRHRIKKKYKECIETIKFIESHADSKFLKKLMKVKQ